MWDCERRGARRRELHDRTTRRQSDRYFCNGQPIMA